MVDRLPWVSGEVFIGALCYMHPLIWRGVYPGVHLIMHGACDRIAIYEQFVGVVPGSMRGPPDLLGVMHPVRACVAGDLAAYCREESRHQTIVDPRDTRQWNRTRLRPVNLS